VDDLQSPVGLLPVHRDQLRAQRLITSMGSFYLFFTGEYFKHANFLSRVNFGIILLNVIFYGSLVLSE